jgi:hypothetical protein
LDIVSLSLATKMLAMLLMSVLSVSVKTNSGEKIEGDLVGFTADVVQIDAAGLTREFPFDELMSLTPTSSKEGTGPTFRVTLAGGSRIAAQDLALLESELVIEPRRQQALQVPVKQVKAIRFRAANTATDPKWLGIVAKESRGDTLVIRRGDNRLDPQYGIVEGIADGKVMFNLDGDKVKAPIVKLEGIVFGAAQTRVQGTNVRVTDVIRVASRFDPAQPRGPAANDANLRFAVTSIATGTDQIDSLERWSCFVGATKAGQHYDQAILSNEARFSLDRKILCPQSDRRRGLGRKRRIIDGVSHRSRLRNICWNRSSTRLSPQWKLVEGFDQARWTDRLGARAGRCRTARLRIAPRQCATFSHDD